MQWVLFTSIQARQGPAGNECMVANVLEKPHALTVVKDAPAVLGPGELRAAVQWSGICGLGALILDVAQAQRRRR